MRTDLRASAAQLEARPSQDGVPFERYTRELWDMIDARLPGFGPAWLRELTMEFRLGGAGFRYPIDPARPYLGDCVIPRPSAALCGVYRGAVDDLVKFRLIPIADARDGDTWMVRDDDSIDPEVLFLESSAWNGAEPSRVNGLVRSRLMLSEFLAFGAAWQN